MQRELVLTRNVHQLANRRSSIREKKTADVHRLFVNVPAVRPEDRAYRIAREHFSVFFAVIIMRLAGKSYDRIGTTDGFILVHAEQARAPETRLARQNGNAVAAKALFDSLTVEQDRLSLTGAEHHGKNSGWECCKSHMWDLQQKSG